MQKQIKEKLRDIFLNFFCKYFYIQNYTFDLIIFLIKIRFFNFLYTMLDIYYVLFVFGILWILTILFVFHILIYLIILLKIKKILWMFSTEESLLALSILSRIHILNYVYFFNFLCLIFAMSRVLSLLLTWIFFKKKN